MGHDPTHPPTLFQAGSASAPPTLHGLTGITSAHHGCGKVLRLTRWAQATHGASREMWGVSVSPIRIPRRPSFFLLAGAAQLLQVVEAEFVRSTFSFFLRRVPRGPELPGTADGRGVQNGTGTAVTYRKGRHVIDPRHMPRGRPRGRLPQGRVPLYQSHESTYSFSVLTNRTQKTPTPTHTPALYASAGCCSSASGSSSIHDSKSASAEVS